MNTLEPDSDQPGNDAWLEKMLREHPSHYIDDDGFTSRVVSALPPRSNHGERMRTVLILGAALIGCLMAFLMIEPLTVESLSELLSPLIAFALSPIPGTGAVLQYGSLAAMLFAAIFGWRTYRQIE